MVLGIVYTSVSPCRCFLQWSGLVSVVHIFSLVSLDSVGNSYCNTVEHETMIEI